MGEAMIHLILRSAPGGTLGPRSQVIVRISDLLPGTVFDASGHGIYHRDTYEVRFQIAGDEPASVDVEFERPDAFTAIKRLVDKTGWHVTHPGSAGGGDVDLDASRAAGRVVTAGLYGDAAHVPAPASPGRRWLAIAAVTVALGMWGYRFFAPSAAITVARVQLPRTRSAKAASWFQQRIDRRNDAMKAIAVDFRNDPVVQQIVDLQLAELDYAHGPGSGRFTSPDRLSDNDAWRRMSLDPLLPQAFAIAQRFGYVFEYRSHGDCRAGALGGQECDAFVYSARPIGHPNRVPLAFALFSSDGQIHMRIDGTHPAEDDPTVAAEGADRGDRR
jgi:hypothetical protein